MRDAEIVRVEWVVCRVWPALSIRLVLMVAWTDNWSPLSPEIAAAVGETGVMNAYSRR